VFVVVTDDHGYIVFVVVTDDHGYIVFVVVTIPLMLSLLLLITGLLNRITRLESITKQENCNSSHVFVVLVLLKPLFYRSLLFFLLAIVLSVLFQFTASDYPFGILKMFLQCIFE